MNRDAVIFKAGSVSACVQRMTSSCYVVKFSFFVFLCFVLILEEKHQFKLDCSATV